jgi:hypothetical protein
MRSYAWVALLAFATIEARAQGLSVTPIAGVTRPQSGEMVLWIPPPAIAGFDSVAYRHSYQPGVTFGALIDFDRPGALDFTVQATANLTERSIQRGSNSHACDCKDSRIYAVALLARGTLSVTERLRLIGGAGPEVLHLSGNAVSNEDGFPGDDWLEIRPRTLLGAFGMLGAEVDVSPRYAVRLHGGYRYFAPRHQRPSRDYPVTPRSFSETPQQDLLFALGLTLRR